MFNLEDVLTKEELEKLRKTSGGKKLGKQKNQKPVQR